MLIFPKQLKFSLFMKQTHSVKKKNNPTNTARWWERLVIHIIYQFRKTETEYLSPVKWCIHVQITQSVEIMTSDCSLRYVPQVQKDIKIHIADDDYASMQGKKKYWPLQS